MEKIEGEIWKEIEGSDGYYLVSNMGRIWVKERTAIRSNGRPQRVKERVYRGYLSRNGYYKARIGCNGETVFSGFVHQLVAMVFMGHEPNGHSVVVDHINHDGTDNRVENLRLVTTRQNTSHRKIKGTSRFPGVFWDKNARKWRSMISVNGKSLHLGLFKDEEEAYFAYLKRLNELLYL
jgi:hypothetical protein